MQDIRMYNLRHMTKTFASTVETRYDEVAYVDFPLMSNFFSGPEFIPSVSI